MLVRIVKMSFIPEKIEDFLANFEENRLRSADLKAASFWNCTGAKTIEIYFLRIVTGKTKQRLKITGIRIFLRKFGQNEDLF